MVQFIGFIINHLGQIRTLFVRLIYFRSLSSCLELIFNGSYQLGHKIGILSFNLFKQNWKKSLHRTYFEVHGRLVF